MQSLFISIDPERDTLERLKNDGEYFHPNIKGVTGTPDQLKDVEKRYGAAYSIVKLGVCHRLRSGSHGRALHY